MFLKNIQFQRFLNSSLKNSTTILATLLYIIFSVLTLFLKQNFNLSTLSLNEFIYYSRIITYIFLFIIHLQYTLFYFVILFIWHLSFNFVYYYLLFYLYIYLYTIYIIFAIIRKIVLLCNCFPKKFYSDFDSDNDYSNIR